MEASAGCTGQHTPGAVAEVALTIMSLAVETARTKRSGRVYVVVAQVTLVVLTVTKQYGPADVPICGTCTFDVRPDAHLLRLRR